MLIEAGASTAICFSSSRRGYMLTVNCICRTAVRFCYAGYMYVSAADIAESKFEGLLEILTSSRASARVVETKAKCGAWRYHTAACWPSTVWCWLGSVVSF